MSADEWSADVWRAVLASDPAYETQILPLLTDLLGPTAGTYLDLGCGEGQAMRTMADEATTVIGVDLSGELLADAVRAGPVVRARLPSLAWAAPGSVDGAFAVLVVEHLAEVGELFAEVARVVAPGGAFVVIRNHPLISAPGSAPVVDPDDGEILWRWGSYLDAGLTLESIGAGVVEFHHHPLGPLLTTAAAAGWVLKRAVEQPLITDDPILEMQRQVPRILGLRFETAP